MGRMVESKKDLRKANKLPRWQLGLIVCELLVPTEFAHKFSLVVYSLNFSTAFYDGVSLMMDIQNPCLLMKTVGRAKITSSHKGCVGNHNIQSCIVFNIMLNNLH